MKLGIRMGEKGGGGNGYWKTEMLGGIVSITAAERSFDMLVEMVPINQ